MVKSRREFSNSNLEAGQHQPYVFWVTGLSGSGKSTLALRLDTWLRDKGFSPIMLDGDQIRDLLFTAAGHDRAARLEVARFISRLCRFLALQGQCVICPTISLFHEIQAWNRKNIPGYVEIFLDVPLTVVRQRDPKGLYAAKDRDEIDNLVGLDIKAEFPENPDFRLRVTDGMSTDQSADLLHEFIEGYFNA